MKVEECPKVVERMLKAFVAHRDSDETFLAFTRRHEIGAFKTMIDGIVAEAAA